MGKIANGQGGAGTQHEADHYVQRGGRVRPGSREAPRRVLFTSRHSSRVPRALYLALRLSLALRLQIITADDVH